MKLVRAILNRLEPWALFLSILAILFVPWGKGFWWATLIAVGCVRLVRAWRDAWQYFSLETMRDVLSGGVFLTTTVVLYFALHHLAPGFVHDPPDLGHLDATELVLRFESRGQAGRLEIRKQGEDEFGVHVFVDPSQLATPAVRGVLRVHDLLMASADQFRTAIPIRDLTGPVGASCSGTIQLDRAGSPITIMVRKGSETRLLGSVTKP